MEECDFHLSAKSIDFYDLWHARLDMRLRAKQIRDSFLLSTHVGFEKFDLVHRDLGDPKMLFLHVVQSTFLPLLMIFQDLCGFIYLLRN